MAAKTAQQGPEREIHTLDATGRPVGRLAVLVAELLRGKQRPGFERHLDSGDFVRVENVGRMKLTGKKAEQKTYYRHSGYLGGLKEANAGELLEQRPEEVLKRAVWGMLPKNKLRQEQIKRLTMQA
ncbi:MAG: 50S ribosomal protein L13 [bacterium]|nr:50S ribosomal protein L13 [bacterium]